MKIDHNKNLTQIKNFSLLALDLGIIFCATFSGEQKFFEIPLFFIFWTIIFVIRRNFVIYKPEILAQLFIILALSPILLQYHKYSFEYYFGTIYVILYVNVIIFGTNVIERLLSNLPGSNLGRWLPGISLVFLGLLTQLLSGSSSRQSFVFGPNVYYRIIGIIFMLHIALFQENYTKAKNKIPIVEIFATITCLLIALLIMVKTGSRGAIIVGGSMLLTFIYSMLSIKIKWLKISIITIVSLIFVVIFQSRLTNALLDSRAFWFYDRGASSGSIAARSAFWQNFLTFLTNDDYLLGEGTNYIYSYAHNLYLDLLYNAGLLPFLLFILFTVISAIILWTYKVNPIWKILFLLFLPIYIGSLFSGTMYNNYSIISMLFMFPIWIQNQVLTKNYRQIKSS
jgi:hypothetical protein